MAYAASSQAFCELRRTELVLVLGQRRVVRWVFAWSLCRAAEAGTSQLKISSRQAGVQP